MRTLEPRPGEVHAIVGENGAGKSTLAKIVAGVYQTDAGEIRIDGRLTVFRRRQDAIAAGVGFLPQALSLVGALSLVENDLLGQKRWRADLGGARAKLAAAAKRTGIAVPLDIPTGRLSLVERQMGELLVALAQDARFLLLDGRPASRPAGGGTAHSLSARPRRRRRRRRPCHPPHQRGDRQRRPRDGPARRPHRASRPG